MKKFLLAVLILGITGYIYFIRETNNVLPVPQKSDSPTNMEELRSKLDSQLPEMFAKLKEDRGSLQVSDNPAKGNLMLLLDVEDRPGIIDKVYIQTVRNYSHLIGKKVLVKFKSGITPEFALDDIVPLE